MIHLNFLLTQYNGNYFFQGLIQFFGPINIIKIIIKTRPVGSIIEVIKDDSLIQIFAKEYQNDKNHSNRLWNWPY